MVRERVRKGSGEGQIMVRGRSGTSSVKSQKFSYMGLTLVDSELVRYFFDRVINSGILAYQYQ